MRFRILALGLAAAGGIALVLASACGEDSTTIPEVTPPADATPPADSGGGGDDGGIDAQPCTPPERPDDGAGVFVAPQGSDDASCGTRQAPCRTIAQGMSRAVSGAKPIVFVAQGTYDERVKLAGGVELSGGWLVDGITTQWAKACGDVKNQIVVVRAPKADNVTIEAINLDGGAAKVTDVSIESKPALQVNPGETIYGVFAAGASTQLVLVNDVIQKIAAGGSGLDGKNGDAGADGGASCLTPSTGMPGSPGTNGTGAAGGTFDDKGYAAANGSDGTNGGNGQNGTAGGDFTCADCGSCAIAVGMGGCGFTAAGPQSCGTHGTPGCAGLGGNLGNAGTGGGSSIAVYCFDATVTINGGRIGAGNGGNGGIGGAGGAGGKGAPGARGSNGADCTSACAPPGDLVTCNNVAGHGDGGVEGGVGGAGGQGGSGGGGAGGWSVALFQGGTGVITSTGATLQHGVAGKGGGPGGGAGTAGTAADRYP